MSVPPKADFRFKQFSIQHDQCAMKVNTDGILLGAWANVGFRKNILDIGTGTGLIALMLAQRSDENCAITAIDIEPDAANQARDNVLNSPWPCKINVIHSDILDWDNSPQNTFDLLVSNPPYFSDALHSPNAQRNAARHNHNLSFEALLAKGFEISTPSAEFCLILPVEESEKLLKCTTGTGWHLIEQTAVYNRTDGKHIRNLLRLSRMPSDTLTENQLFIRNKDNSYHQNYIDLCKAFYLKM